MYMFRDMASCSEALISLLVNQGWTARWRPMTTTTTRCCCVQRRVVMWVRCKTDVKGTTAAALASFYQWRRVAVVVDCSAVECDRCRSQRPTRDLRCLTTSDAATWRRRMNEELYRGHLLHSPTHSRSHRLTDCMQSSVLCGSQRLRDRRYKLERFAT